MKRKKIPIWKTSELEEFFATAVLPDVPFMLDCCTTIVDMDKFIDTHLQTAKKHDGNETFKPYYDRLVKLKELIS